MKKYFCLILLIVYNCVFSQDNKNIVGLDVLGHSDSFIAIHYERLFSTNVEKIAYSLGVGIGRKPGYDTKGSHFNGVTTLPVVLSILYGKKHFIEFGLGYVALFSEDYTYSSTEVYKKFESDISVSLGYRLMLESGLVVQAYPVFILKDNPVTKSKFSFGVGVGYLF